MSARENIAKNIENQLKNMSNPAPGKVSRVFFDVQKLFGADGGTSINPATQNETHTINDPQLAGIIADNYANAFSVSFPQ